MCLLFAFEIIILCEAEAFKNRIWYFKTWEDVAWQPVVGMQGTSVVFLYQPSIAVFWRSPFPHCTLGGAVSHGSKPPWSKDAIPSQPGQLEVLPLGGKNSGKREGKTLGTDVAL